MRINSALCSPANYLFLLFGHSRTFPYKIQLLSCEYLCFRENTRYLKSWPFFKNIPVFSCDPALLNSTLVISLYTPTEFCKNSMQNMVSAIDEKKTKNV